MPDHLEGSTPVAVESLGLVETRGWVGAVEAADAMCKAAAVRLVRYEVVRDGWITVIVRGPLADVEAAVAAGGAAAARVGECLIRHVIARPDEQLEKPLAGAAGSGGAPSP